MKFNAVIAAAVIASAAAIPVAYNDGSIKYDLLPTPAAGAPTPSRIYDADSLKRDLEDALSSVLERRKGGGSSHPAKPAPAKPASPAPAKPASPAPAKPDTPPAEKPSPSPSHTPHSWNFESPSISLPDININDPTTVTATPTPSATPAPMLARRRGGGSSHGSKPAAAKPAAAKIAPAKPAPEKPAPEKPAPSAPAPTHEWSFDGPEISLPDINIGNPSTVTATPSATPAP